MEVDNQKKYSDKIKALRPLFARAAIGDFSEDVPSVDMDDDLAELYTGIQTMVEVVRDKISNLEAEVGQRQEAEQRLIMKNREQAEIHKAMLNIMEDLEETKTFLEQESAKFSTLIGSIGDGVIATDDAGKIIFINDAALDMLGLSADDVVAQNLIETIKMEDEKGNSVEADARPLRIAMASGAVYSSSDNFYIRKDKVRFPISLTVSPVVSGRRKVGSIEVFRDITKEKELDRAKSEFISVASHQLRTPVTALKWLAEIMAPSFEKLGVEEQSYFRDLNFSVERLSRLVEDLLNVSRIELGTLKEEKIRIDLVKFIKDFLGDLKPYFILKKHKIAFSSSSDSVPIDMDSKMLYNVLQNLVSNAVDYSPPDTEVAVMLETGGDSVKVSVSNQGPVIPKDEQKKLFQKFYRGESTLKMKADGTGLGLYIVKSNIEKAGGSVGFISEKEKPTTFWFSLPVGK